MRPVDATTCPACQAPIPQNPPSPQHPPGPAAAAAAPSAPASAPASAGVGATIQSASDRITAQLGLDRIEGFSLRHFFSEVFRSHAPDEVERQLSVGAPDTTPDLHVAMGVMPTPWIFFRALTGAAVAYLIFLLAWRLFHNNNLVPGLIFLGSFAVPFSVLILFFELNTPRNVSIIRLFEMVIVGGALSLLLTLFLFQLTPFLGGLGASAAAFVEEPGKLAALLFAVRKLQGKYRHRLNGLLLGAAIGAGFAAFESAGYALRAGLQGGDTAMLDTIQLRGLLSPFGHIAWTAVAASAFWIARPGFTNMAETLQSPRFLKLFAAPVALHFVWNLPFAGPFLLKFWILGFLVWVIIISLVQSGLKEMRELAGSAATPLPGAEPQAVPAGA